VVRAIVGTATKRTSPEELRRQSEKLRDDAPWTERLAGIGWSLLLGSLVLRAFGFD
jgi:hypothetical protein